MAILPRQVPGWMTPNRSGAVKPAFPPVPQDIQRAMDRGRRAMVRDAHKRRLCAMFTRGDNFSWISGKNALFSLPTVTNPNGTGKPAHRMRNAFNHIGPLVEDKVSAATSRIPSYEVVASTADPEDRVAADVSQKVALYLYDKARLRKIRMKVVKSAIAHGGDGFALPYFEPNVGPYKPDASGAMTGLGEVRVMTFGGNEVYWEAGVEFDDSRWWATEQAMAMDAVKQIPGFIGGELVADGATSDVSPDTDVASDNLVMVTNFYERPCPEYPRGRWLRIANKGIIVDARLIPDDSADPAVDRSLEPLWEEYPLVGHDGETLDEPLIHRLYYKVDPDSKKRDLGLVWDLIDPQRSIDDCVAGETLVTTAEGLRSARDLAGRTVSTLAGDGVFRDAVWAAYGVKKLWEVTFDDGTKVHATQNHRWIVNRSGRGRVTEVTTPLLVGERVPYCTLAAHTPVGDHARWLAGVQNGLMWGDGTVERHRRKDREYVYGSIRQYGSDENLGLVERFFPDTCTKRREYDGLPWIQARRIDPAMKSLPAFDEGLDYLRGFLAGAIASDGSVTECVTIAQSNRQELEAVATIARTVGIGVVSLKHAAKGSWHLRLAGASFADDLGVDENLILKPSHQRKLGRAVGWRRARTQLVVDVRPTDRVEEVYCCVEPVTQSWIMGNSMVTGNCVNKLLEWKNRCLNPQMKAQINSLLAGVTPNDEPGFVYWYKPGTSPPEHMQAPPLPQELFQLYTTLREMMQFFASYADAQASPNVAAASVQAVQQQASARWESFLGDLAEFDSRLMRHCLVLVARHYTQPRLLQIDGWFGPDSIPDFTGAQLMGQMDVTVLPGSLTQLSRGEMLNRIQFIVQMFPGFLSPEMALAALDGGAAMSLIRGYELDVARVDRVIRAIHDGSVMTAFGTRQEIDPATGQTLMGPPEPVVNPVTGAPIIDHMTGQPAMQPSTTPAEVPGYMPMRDIDNLAVWRQHLGDWCKTPDFERSAPQQQDVAKQILAYISVLEGEQAAKQAAQMQAQASQLGMTSAQKPAGPKALPSTPDAATP